VHEVGTIACGDCLDLVPGLATGSVDLVYADPPFGSGRRRQGPAGASGYDDAWPGGMEAYPAWLRPRLAELHRVLAPTGSLFLHLDWRSAHHGRLLLDEIFGPAAFRNELVWHYGLGGRAPANAFARKHDTILFYARGEANRFRPQRGPVTAAMAAKYAHRDHRGRYQNAHGRRYYLQGGKLWDSVWEIPSIAPGARERTGYPTQKPEALLERIVLAATDPGDLVLDPFVGSGTTPAVCRRLGRRFVAFDLSPQAIAVTRSRLATAAVA
jgi:site-specific DNA-methyltransferase (adenine-specific)